MLEKSHKKEEILLSILEFLKRNGYKECFEKLQEKTNFKHIEQNNIQLEKLITSDNIMELISYIKSNIQITNEEKMYFIKLLKIKYYIKLVLNNCINGKNQKDSLDYLRTEITPLLNEDSTELINSLTYILFIKEESILNEYIKNFLLSYTDNNFIINQICKKNITPLEYIYDNYKNTKNNINLYFNNYSTLTIQDNCFTPFKSSEIWFLEISKNKNYICAAFANSNISIFNIKKEIKENKIEIKIKLYITFSGNEQNKRDEITALTFSNDEKYILVGLSNFKLKIFDILNGEKIKEYQNIHKDKITSIIPLPNSNSKFFTGCIDKKIKILDISNITNINNKDKEEYVELGTFCRIRQICYSEILNYIIIISASNTEIIIYNLIAKKIEYKIITSEGSQNIYGNISKKDKGKYFIYSITNNNNKSKIILYNLTTKLVEEKYLGFSQKYMIIKCCFGGTEDKFILSGSEDYSVYVWIRGMGESPKYKFQGHFGIVNTIDMWENDFIISGSDDKTLKVWYGGNRNLEIQFEKNKENKFVIKESTIDKEFLEAMNDGNDNSDNNIFSLPLSQRIFFGNDIENNRMDIDDGQEDEQIEENENEFEEDDNSNNDNW